MNKFFVVIFFSILACKSFANPTDCCQSCPQKNMAMIVRQNAKECIEQVTNDRIYLDPRRLHLEENGLYLAGDHGIFLLSDTFVDEQGYYIFSCNNEPMQDRTVYPVTSKCPKCGYKNIYVPWGNTECANCGYRY